MEGWPLLAKAVDMLKWDDDAPDYTRPGMKASVGPPLCVSSPLIYKVISCLCSLFVSWIVAQGGLSRKLASFDCTYQNAKGSKEWLTIAP